RRNAAAAPWSDLHPAKPPGNADASIGRWWRELGKLGRRSRHRDAVLEGVGARPHGSGMSARLEIPDDFSRRRKRLRIQHELRRQYRRTRSRRDAAGGPEARSDPDCETTLRRT